jgi:hypothetical protein
VALAAILVATALLRLRLLAVPLERDEGEFAYLAQLILRGETPYVAAHNMKLPGIYYGYAAALALFGESALAVHLGLLVVNLVAIVLLERLGRRLVDATAGLAAAASYAVLSIGEAVLGFSAQAEHFIVAPTLGALLVLLGAEAGRQRWRLFAAGLLLGFAFVVKQHAWAFVAFGGLWVLATGLARGRAALRATAVDATAFAAGALLPLGLACLGTWLAGAFEPFWFWTFVYAYEYVSMVPLAAGLAELRARVAEIGGPSLAVWALAAVGVAALWWDDRVARRRGFLAAFAMFSFLAVSPGLLFREHYFVLLLPAASLLAGAGVSAAGRAVERRRPALAPWVRIGLPLAAAALSVLQQREYLFLRTPEAIARASFGRNPFPESVEIARFLRERAAPGDRVAVIGSEPQIYFLSGLRAATSYMYVYPMMEPQPYARAMQEDFIAQVERVKPRFLVLVNVDASWSRRPASSTRLLDWSAKLANDEYRPIGLAEIYRDRPAVYRWGEEAEAAEPRSDSFVVTLERRS